MSRRRRPFEFQFARFLGQDRAENIRGKLAILLSAFSCPKLGDAKEPHIVSHRPARLA